MKFTVILLLGLVPFCLSERTSYENYKVYRVVPVTEGDVKVLRNFEKLDEHVDFWSEMRVLGNPVDVMVPPGLQGVFVETLEFEGISFVEMIQNVEETLQEERLRQSLAERTASGRISFQKYLRYGEITSYLKKLETDYPDIVKVEYPGTTFEARHLAMIKISTGGSNKPIILVDAGIHAREWIAPAMAVYIINQLVENPANRHMIENVDWHIIPVLNPDGYEYSHRVNRLWRKTRSFGKVCDGVDGNRNFDFHWGEVGVSFNECQDIYCGPKAMSEPETQTLARVVKENASRIKLYLTFHSYGNYILYPWGFTSALPENADELHSVGEKVANAIRNVYGTTYTIGSSTNVLYAAAGGSDDWVKAVGGVELAYTLEFPGGGSSGFDPPPSRIVTIGKETFEGIKEYHKYIDEKY